MWFLPVQPVALALLSAQSFVVSPAEQEEPPATADPAQPVSLVPS